MKLVLTFLECLNLYKSALVICRRWIFKYNSAIYRGTRSPCIDLSDKTICIWLLIIYVNQPLKNIRKHDCCKKVTFFKSEQQAQLWGKISVYFNWGVRKRHLLSSANEHWCKEAKGHPQFIYTRLVICDVPEIQRRKFKRSCPCLSVNIKTLLDSSSPVPGVHKVLQN